MKKLFILALALCLMGCGNNDNVTNIEAPIVTVDGTVMDKYEKDEPLNLYAYTHHLIVNVEYPNEDEMFDISVAEYIYNYYEIGDTIAFALNGRRTL